MSARDQRIAAAKRKVQEYKALHRAETEKNNVIQSSPQIVNVVGENDVDTSIKEFVTPPDIPPPQPHENGTLALTIDESEHGLDVPSQIAEVAVSTDIPSSNDFAANQGNELMKSNTNVEDETASNTNRNTLPNVTASERAERVSDVRQWVESDTWSKSMYPGNVDQTPLSEPAQNDHYTPNSISSTQPQPQGYSNQIHHLNGIEVERNSAMEQELTRLRQSNVQLQKRERELVSHLENVEMVIQKLTKERDGLQEEIKLEFVPLKQNYAKMFDENTELKVIVSDLRLQLNSALEEHEGTKKQLEDMQSAFIKMSNMKRELESNWDIEQERLKMLEDTLKARSFQVEELMQQTQNSTETQKTLEAAFHNCEEEARVLKNKNIMLEKQVLDLTNAATIVQNTKSETEVDSAQHIQPTSTLEQEQQEQSSSHASVTMTMSDHGHSHGDGAANHDTEHQHTGCDGHHDHNHPEEHQHPHDHHGHEHEGHDHHDHDGHDHHHDHHGHGHSHDHDHRHSDNTNVILPPADGPTPMEKKLARLEWENLTFREELDKLAATLKTKTVEADELEKLRVENKALHQELSRLEHLVIQLQAENDTIGDYISLYQTQKLVLKEKVREKDREMETLSRERAELRDKMEELNDLLKNFNEATDEKPVQKINELITSINNSSATLHSCSVCSGTLLNV